MIISGANLGTQEVEFKRLTSYFKSKDENLNKAIEFIQNNYLNAYAGEGEVKPILVDEEGKVILTKGMTNHRCSYRVDALKNLAKYGIVASEWFGVLESELEGRFCSFISRIKGEDYPSTLDENDRSRLNTGRNVLLFFDDSNETMKKLMHLDFFEYEYLKSKGDVDLNSIYTEDEINMLESISKLSPGGKTMRKEYDFKTNYWSAIPGGIPPFLVNGICIKRVKYTDEELDEISSLFPNAVIFNNEKTVIRRPLNYSNDDFNK